MRKSKKKPEGKVFYFESKDTSKVNYLGMKYYFLVDGEGIPGVEEVQTIVCFPEKNNYFCLFISRNAAINQHSSNWSHNLTQVVTEETKKVWLNRKSTRELKTETELLAMVLAYDMFQTRPHKLKFEEPSDNE